MTTMKLRIDRAQRRIRLYIQPGRSLADELIAERRGDAKRSAKPRKSNPSLLDKT
jgi:hypothetical protein